MARITSFFSKWWLLILLSFVATILIAFRLSKQKVIPEFPSPPVTPSPPPISRFKLRTIWKDIIPGETTKDQLKEILGEPISQRKEDNLFVYEFPSNSKVRPHQVLIDKDTVVLIKEQITQADNKGLSFFTKIYGQPEEILFGPHAAVGFQVAVYYKSGLAVVNNPTNGTVLEAWYFNPITKEEFLKTWGKDLEKERPKILD